VSRCTCSTSGDHIERFGGSSRGLTAVKTASLVTRTFQHGICSDVEYDIHDKNVWEWIAKIMNGEIEATFQAVAMPQPAKKEAAGGVA
jgi:hypothetical protein